MPVSGNWLVAQQLVTTVLFQLLRLMFIIVQRIYWELNGTARKLRAAHLPQNYEQSAQVLDVVFAHKFCPLQTTTISNFLCTHNRFENPQYVIDNDDITLMTINDDDSVFCEPVEKDMHLWKMKYGGFMHYAQMNYCRRLIIVPRATFHRMAETIGDPKGELTFLFNVPRSGSTLLTQIMEFTERCVSVSEPTSPVIVTMKYQKFGDSPELHQLAHDVMRWECRPYPTMQPQPLGYFLKLFFADILVLPLYRELFPSCRFLFVYRDVEKVAKSVSRTKMVSPLPYLICEVGKLSSRVSKMMVDAVGLNGADYCARMHSNLTLGVFFTALTTTLYLDARRRGFDIRAVRYEDLVARPLDMCRVILEFCHLPVSLAELAVKAFDVDSQRNSPLARSIVGHLKEAEMTPEVRVKLNELLKKFELPLIGKPSILEGTLTC